MGMTPEQIRELATLCRELGIARIKYADVEMELVPERIQEASSVYVPEQPEKPAVEEKVNPQTGLTPTQEREWFGR